MKLIELNGLLDKLRFWSEVSDNASRLRNGRLEFELDRELIRCEFKGMSLSASSKLAVARARSADGLSSLVDDATVSAGGGELSNSDISI